MRFEIEDDGAGNREPAECLPVDAKMDAGEAQRRPLRCLEVLLA